jgi:hypothetical protein
MLVSTMTKTTTMLSTVISISTLLLLSSTCIWLFTIPVWCYGASIMITASWATPTSFITSSMTTVTSMTIDPFRSLSYTLTTTIPCKLSPFFLRKCMSCIFTKSYQSGCGISHYIWTVLCVHGSFSSQHDFSHSHSHSHSIFPVLSFAMGLINLIKPITLTLS